ncbi:MAG: carboxypeptidase-like regulatory domain-containing protein [Bacteroidia bacterium]|nr:carboxypeptidase-like regulatory domain-containing protein [Bacteroidia bacterium]
MRYIIIFLFLTAATTFALGQNRISGKIIDRETLQPLAFVQIRALNARVGTLSNEEGVFVLKLNTSAPDTILFSHIGYEVVKAPLSGFVEEETVTIRLQEKIVSLAEVVIHPVEAEDLLRQALAAIPENYNHNPLNMQGFYREMIRKDGQPAQLSEAVVDIYKVPNGKEETDENRLRLLRGRSFTDSALLGKIKVNIGGGGPKNITGRAVTGETMGENFLDPKEFKHYEYTLSGVSTISERMVYEIAFDQREDIGRRLYQGKVYLDVKTLAFVSIDYKMSEKGKKFPLIRALGFKAAAALTLLRTMGVRLDFNREAGHTDYVYDRGKWYLNYSSIDLGALLTTKGKMDMPESLNIGVSVEMLITQMEPGKANRFADSELINDEVALKEQVGEFDETFWENYNYFHPGVKLKEAVEKIKGQ